MWFVLADGISIQIGDQVWAFGWNLIVFLGVAAIVGLVAEAIVRWRLPFGMIGAIIVAVLGVWLMTQVVIVRGVGDFYIAGVPLVRALIGAIILVLIWSLITRPRYVR